MDTLLITASAAFALLLIPTVGWILSASRHRRQLRQLRGQLSEREADLVRKEAALLTSETLRANEREQHEQLVTEIRENQEKALQAARTALALENEQALKAREEALKREAEQTIQSLTSGLDQHIKEMKDAFEAQKKTHAEESASIKTQFAETVRHLREQTDVIGTKAEHLSSALKGQNKMQGIFGETLLENLLKSEGLRRGVDYDAESTLRDTDGSLLVSEGTGKRMRPDFILHFPDRTDILIDAKVSLSALSDYFDAETDAQREDAAHRNLASVLAHVRELSSKEYQKYVAGRKTLEYVIMFIPNYGAYQLARQEDPELFARAFRENVLITTEETLLPFLRLIRSAWVQQEQMENIAEIVKAAQDMVDRVALFCEENARVQSVLEGALATFRKNAARLTESKQSIVGAAWRAVRHGIREPSGHHLPPIPEE